MVLSLSPLICWGQNAATQVVGGEEFVTRATAVLAERSASLEGEIEWKAVGSATHSQVPAGEYELRAGDLHGEWPRRRVGVPVQIWMSGQMVQSRMVWFSVHWWKEGMVYMQDAKSGDQAHPELIQSQRLDAIGSEVITSTDLAWMENMRLRRSVRAGQPVQKSDFGPIPIVARDDEVQMSVQVGLVRIVTKGLANQEGAVNDVIDVRTEGSPKIVKARITARNEVQVER